MAYCFRTIFLGCLHCRQLWKLEIGSPQWRTGLFAVQYNNNIGIMTSWAKVGQGCSKPVVGGWDFLSSEFP